jgi:very-short-patch-repair endonuclease
MGWWKLKINNGELKMKKYDNKYRDTVFMQLLRNAGLPEPEREFRFHEERMWRFDFAYPAMNIAIEVEGGVFGRPVVCNHCKQKVTRTIKDKNGKVRTVLVTEGSGHNTGAAIKKDAEKYNYAAILGWRVLRFIPDDLHKVETIEMIKEAMQLKEKSYMVENKMF